MSWALAAAVLALLLVVPLGAAAQVSTPAAEDQVYVSADKTFQIPIPTNWTAEERDGYVRISTSDGKIEVSAAIVGAPGATPGIDLFLRTLDADFENESLADLIATPATTTDDTALYTIDDGSESGRLLQAIGRKVGDGSVFVLVLDGELEAVKLRQVQVDKIFEGTLIRTESDATPVASPAA